MRIIHLIALLTPMMLLSAAAAAFVDGEPAPLTVELKPSAVVEDELIVLGDLFANAGDQAGEPVAYAPAPGRQATYGAKWLYQIAQHFRLPWQPMSARDSIVIERSSVVISREEIEARILEHLQLGDLGSGFSVSLSNRMLRLHLPADKPADFEIADLYYDSATQRLSAVVAAPAGDPAAERTRVLGSVHQVIDVPVVVRPVAAGEMIRERDIEWRRMRAKKIARDTVIALGELIGMSPRRGLMPGKPVRRSEIVAPELVARNSLVTITIEQPSMRLTAQGKALDAGAKGDVIRVLNTRSNNVVEAQVTAPGRAVVHPPTTVAMN